ncbi:LysR family transcriptional regulator [Paenibacillus sanguinis]|uniref:LysR family transcriptional regulator n=1 Tax=Paenibacillus sanguinis TaxID=225906 RepID=UPI00035C2796|nr:LysR family transcriptional regulator [Paenibacillus sanguinis]
MNIRKLQYICTIAEEQNITKAAQMLFVAQPYLSALITNVEKSLGVKLFDRSVSPLQLTYAGHLYIEAAYKMIDLHNQLEHKLQDIKQLKAGKVSVGCPFSLGSYILPLILPKFHLKYPAIKLELHELLIAEMEHRLARGQLDVAFTSSMTQDKNLSHVPILNQVYKLATHAHHPFVQKFPDRLLSVSDLANEQFVSNIPGTLFREQLEQFFQEAKLDYNVLLNCKNSETAKALVAQGFGVMFLHESMIDKENNPHHLVYFSLKEQAPKFTISIVTNPQTYTSLAASKFLEMVYSEFQV